jgi:4-amino-4-deoxy-L-arabinose transferase-like glycosyltransferase
MKSHLKPILSSPVLITSFAFALRMLLLCMGARSEPNPVITNLPFGFELGQVAKAIASGRGFSSPLAILATGPTVWFTPIYPYFVAGIFKVWGIFTPMSHIIIQTLNCAFASLTVIPIQGIAKRTFGEGVATGAAWTWVFLPSAVSFPIQWVWDTALIALVFSLIFWATLAMREKRGALAWAGYGALWAVGVLINPSILSLFPFFLGWLAWEARRAAFPWIKPAAATLLVFALCMVPWTVRNYHVFGKLTVLRSNFGLELWLGNNSKVVDTMAPGQHPAGNREEAEKYKRMGEIAYMADKEQEAFAYMRSHPRVTLNLIFFRFMDTWLASTESPLDVLSTGNLLSRSIFLSNFSLSMLCFLGALYAYRSGRPEAFPFAIVPTIFPLIFYLTHSTLRYRFPIDPIILILAISAAAHLISVARSRVANVKKAAAPAPSLPAI